MKIKRIRLLAALLTGVAALVILWWLAVKSYTASPQGGRILYSGAGGTVKSLDPAFADDLASRDLTALCYDTLLQYDYLARPYKLKPSMIKMMPEISADGKSYTFELRDDLLFAADSCFDTPESRKRTPSSLSRKDVTAL